MARQRRADHVVLDQAVVAGAALVGVAIALDQARALGDFERKLGRQRGGLRDQVEPALDLALLLGVALGARAEAPQFCQQPEAQIAR